MPGSRRSSRRGNGNPLQYPDRKILQTEETAGYSPQCCKEWAEQTRTLPLGHLGPDETKAGELWLNGFS